MLGKGLVSLFGLLFGHLTDDGSTRTSKAETSAPRATWMLATVLAVSMFASSSSVYADGTETLGLTALAEGTGIASGGTGLFLDGTGTIDVNVGGTPQQAYLYWMIRNEENPPNLPGSTSTIDVNGSPLIGGRIGGTDDPATSAYFDIFSIQPRYFATYRADVTSLISSGANSLNLSIGAGGVSDGAGIVVSFSDGGAASATELRDGIDTASSIQDGPRLSTVKQDFTVAAASETRNGTITLLVGDVGTDSGSVIDRVQITVGGVVSNFDNVLFGDSLWTTQTYPIDVPAGVTQVSVQLCSGNECPVAPPNPLNSSLIWVAAALDIPPLPTASLGDRVWLDTDGDGQQDCTEGSSPPDDILGNAGDTGPECGNGVPNVMVNLLDPVDGICGNGNDIPSGASPNTTMTDANGFYSFTGLEAGSYCVAWKKPPGLECTAENVGDNASDSDGVDIGGGICSVNELITLAPGDNDLTWDLGLEEPPTVSLGDRVWKDLDGDGTQDCTEGSTPPDDILGNAGDTGPECGEGIDGVTVDLLLGDCASGNMIAQDTTSNGGFYLFDGLDPNGSYCVMFGTPQEPGFCDVTVNDVVIDLGDPLFTLRNEGDDGADSDADPMTGKSGDINLSGTDDLTIDAGIVCPVKIGDRVWEDDGDGIQNPGEDDANIEGVKALLYSCGDNMDFENGGGDDMLLAEQVTDASGMYMFGGRVPGPTLDPGKYYVIFDSGSYPDGYSATLPGQGSEDEDSECMPEMCIDLTASGAVNLAQDCGLVPPPPPECKLALDKSCLVATPPPQDFDKCDGKLEQFTVEWTGGEIQISGLPNDSGGNVSNGQKVTFFGPFDQNDVVVNISGAAENGESVFHMSCSDPDFNDPSDCDKPAGNGKSNDSNFLDLWTLKGFIDKEGRVLDCDGGSNGEFTNSCSFEKPPAPSCETTGDPDTLTWRFDGGSCADSTFDVQKDFECTGSVDNGLQITVIDDKGGSFLLNPGDEFTTSRDASKELSLTDSDGGTQGIVLHTSCSQPIEAGLTAGALTLVALDGQTGGADVTYRYLVTNEGDPLDDVVVTDNLLGDIGGPVALGAGGTAMFDKTVTLFETTTNIGTAKGTKLTGGGVCEPAAMASDDVMVTVTEPTCQVSIVLDKIEDKKIKWKLSNSSNIDATIDDLTISWLGGTKLKKVKFDGNDIVKDEALDGPDADLPADVGGEWLKEVKDRTLKAGDTEKIEFEFTGDFPLKKNQPASDFDLKVNFEEGCSVEF